MKTCEHCGGLIATEDGERIAGTLCRCGFAAVPGSAVATKAARYEIEEAIKRAETVGRRLRHSLMGRAYTIRKSDADIVDLEIIPHLRRALVHLPND